MEALHLSEDTLSALAAEALAPDDPTVVAAHAHLEGCETCRAELEGIKGLLFSNTLAATPAGKSTNPDGPRGQATKGQGSLTRGQSLGRYVLLEKLGHGGMGEVFAAYDPQLDRKVALKLLRGGALSADEGKARLIREAQAMAKLSHPNVVAVHDVGTYGDRVFVAMEFVEGETLTESMRGKRGWQELVRIFLQAGSGLAAAHQAGIVHRDFKPDNVLIGTDGRPRVLDFGLARQAAGSSGDAGARALAGDTALDSGQQPLTRDGAVMGTPGYMAPEQLAGLPADARSDQFSFCVAVYEALYGKRPFGGATLKAHAAEMLAGKPPPPPPGTSAPPYLFAVLQRGLSANPSDRFPTMEALIDALRPRAKEQGRKRTLALGALAAGLLGLGLWALSGRASLAVCSGGEKQLAGLWDAPTRAQLERAFLATGSPLAADTFSRVGIALDDWTRAWLKSERDSCEAARIRKTDTDELFSLKSVCLSAQLKELKARVGIWSAIDREALALAVTAARSLPKPEACLDVVALTAAAPSRSRSPEDAQAEEAVLSLLIDARALFESGKYEQSAEVAKGAAQRSAPPGVSSEAWLVYGRSLDRAGRGEKAEEAFFEAARLAVLAGDPGRAARAFARIQTLRTSVLGRASEAPRWSQLAEASARRVPNDVDADTEVAANAGFVALARGDYAEARKNFLHALEQLKETRGEEHPEVAMALNNLATAYAREGKLKEAADAYERAYALHQKLVGAEHPNTASSMHNLARIYRQEGRLSEALELFERALAVREKTLGPEHPETANSHLALGNLLAEQNRPDEALGHLREALRIRQTALGPQHLQTGNAWSDLASFYEKRGHHQEALEAAKEALAIAEKTVGPEHPTAAEAHERIGRAYMGLGLWEKSNLELLRALELRRAKPGPRSPDYARSLNALGELAFGQKRFERASALFKEALEVREAAGGAESPRLAEDLLGLGDCLLALGKSAEALPYLERALPLAERSENAAARGRIRFSLAQALLQQSSPEERTRAVALATEAKAEVSERLKAQVDSWLSAHAGAR